MEKINITAIIGSLRKDSFNRQLAGEAGKILQELAKSKAASGIKLNIDFELLDYSDIPLFNQDIEHPAPEPVSRIRDIVKKADGLWFFTPEYNHFFPGVLKNLIDWLSRPVSDTEPHVLGQKAAAVSGITPGISATLMAQDHLITLLSFLNVRIMNLPRLFIPNAMQQTNPAGRLSLSTSRPFLEKQAESFVDFIRKV